ncbi:synaptonemal complex protein 1 [Alistipes onderdonkii]|uniref:hypothetical protein n=1 Tax=Alistipes onderdonkii TaxID=328813 RepID=UPI001875B570|nr:hypothetical protein [Alistipes onderdonkii]MBE5046063.1 hypothetical protein [Alistipes onderdonkii]
MATEQIQIQSRAGKRLLKICMGDLYPNPMVVYREYIQNSCDALVEAERQGLFGSSIQKTVSITIGSNSITVHDRGVGVRMDDVVRSLIDLSFSQKTGDAIGRYGVGRLTGAKYCDELIFETSAYNENRKSIVRFDAKKAREIIASDLELEVTEVIDMVTTYTREDANLEDHFFRVTMNNVTERHLLDREKAEEYLSVTVPIDFSAQFKDYILNPAFDNQPEFSNAYKRLVSCHVVVNGVNIKKPYEHVVRNSSNIEERIGKAKFFKLDTDGELLAWGWYSMTASAKQFLSNIPFRKVRLRQLNMAVGDETYLDNVYGKDVDASYFIGEVYVIHPQIEPTTGREGLTDNAYTKAFFNQLEQQFKQMAKEYNTLSKFGSQVLEPLAKYTRELRIINNEVGAGIRTAEEIHTKKSETIIALKEVKNKLANDLAKIRKDGKIVDRVDDVVGYYQEQSDAETEKYNKVKDTQKNNIQINKFSIFTEIEKIMGDKDKVDQKTTEEITTTNNCQGNLSNVSPAINKQENEGSLQPESKNSELDIYRGMTQLEVTLIRKVYKIINGQKGLDPKIREKLKAKMAKHLPQR